MGCLLDLPDEVLLEILSYVQAVPPSANGYPFHSLPQSFKGYNQAQRSKATTLSSLIHCCRHLRRLTSQLLCYLPLTFRKFQYSTREADIQSANLILDSPSDLGHLVTQVHIDGNFAEVFSKLMGLPNIHTLCINDWKDWQPLEWVDFDYQRKSKGFSSVRSLLISQCDALPAGLRQFLSWPKNLTHLFLEVELLREPIANTLQPHLSTLRQLTITAYRAVVDLLGPFRSDFLLDLRDFTALTSLRVEADYFLGRPDDMLTVSRMPPMLEEFETAHRYDSDLRLLFRQSVGSPQPSWLSELLRQKAKGTRFKGLKRMRFISMKWDPGHKNEKNDTGAAETVTEMVEGMGASKSSWSPPIEIVNAFVKAEAKNGSKTHGMTPRIDVDTSYRKHFEDENFSVTFASAVEAESVLRPEGENDNQLMRGGRYGCHGIVTPSYPSVDGGMKIELYDQGTSIEEFDLSLEVLVS